MSKKYALAIAVRLGKNSIWYVSALNEPAVCGRLLSLFSVYERDMRKRLRKVTEECLAAGSYSSESRPTIVAQREESLENLARLLAPPLQHEVVREPKAALVVDVTVSIRF